MFTPLRYFHSLRSARVSTLPLYLAMALLILATSTADAQRQRPDSPRSAAPRGLGQRAAEQRAAQQRAEQQRAAERRAAEGRNAYAAARAAFAAATPSTANEFSSAQAAALQRAAQALDAAVAEMTRLDDAASIAARLTLVDRLAALLGEVDSTFVRTLALRKEFATQTADAARQERLRAYVASLNALVDLSGRLRYTALAAIDAEGVELSTEPAQFVRVCNQLAAAKCDIGATTLAPLLYEPIVDGEGKSQPLGSAEKAAILALIAATTPADALGDLAEFVRSPQTPPQLAVVAADAIRRIGLPQDPLPDGDEELPRPEITADELHALLAKLDETKLDGPRAAQRRELLAWLDGRRKSGVVKDDALRIGGEEVRPGDWLLMRNPSPYNLFSDLAPGLFTHVGIVAEFTPRDGKRRIVVVDLPERGTRLPATPADTFVKRALHCLFLRHGDAAATQRMAEIGKLVIGNPSQFDLNFRIDRVEKLKGTTLAGKKIETYCAGLLWLCAQETGKPRTEFFPIRERGAGGRSAANLSQLGIVIGDDFVSPTGPIFSRSLEVVARKRPMYSPEREIEQAVFDHFAAGVRDRKLAPSLDQYQTLRLKLAEAAKTNELLAAALAKANNVNADMDLVSAAKAAAVVETLDETAYGASRAFAETRDAITFEDDPADPAGAEVKKTIQATRRRYADLVRRWQADELSSRELRMILVAKAIAGGKQRIDERFFSGSSDAAR